MPRSPSPSRSRSRSYSRSRSRSPVRRGRSVTPDEEALSPFLIRIYVTKGKHVPLVEFDEGNIPLRDEFQVYGWKSSTPSSLIRSLLPSFPPPYRSPLARYSFRHIYVDASSRGLYRSKDLISFTGRELFSSSSSSSSSSSKPNNNGVEENKMDMDLDLDDINSGAGAGKLSKKIDEKSLDEYGFVTGDLISISLYIPEPKLPAGGPSSSSRNPRDRDLPSGAPGGVGGPSGKNSFGWGERDKIVNNKEDHWHKGQPLPPQEFRIAGRGGRAVGDSRNGEPAGGGSWRGGAAGGGGFGIRGHQARTGGRRSPDYGRDRDRDGEAVNRRNGEDGRRSRSPEIRREGRRESWGSRR